MNKKELGILVFGHTRPLYIADVLESLKLQSAIQYVDLWLDGHQGKPDYQKLCELSFNIASNYDVNNIIKHNGHIGFRKLIITALEDAINKYKNIIILEDDCFPTRHCVEMFRESLEKIKDKNEIFSVYGHPFLIGEENNICTRFQGWGWGTTDDKLMPYLVKLKDCYLLPEWKYLEFVRQNLDSCTINRLDVTPPRLPTITLKKFFAWDETLALLTAIDKKSHYLTRERSIYNFGASANSSRFKYLKYYQEPPYNMVSHENIWDYY